MTNQGRMHNLRCEVCGNAFQARKISALYCSDACKMKAYRAKKSNAKKSKKVNKSDNPTASVKTNMRTCAHCDTRFRWDRKDQIFCSPSCRVVSNRVKIARTVSKVKHESGMKDFDIFQIADAEGWKSLYSWLENRGFKWSPTREMWLTDLEKLAQGELL